MPYEKLFTLPAVLLLFSCAQNKVDNSTTNTQTVASDTSQPAQVYKLNDEIFDGYKFGMSLDDAKKVGSKNSDKLKPKSNTLVGSHIIQCDEGGGPAFKVKVNSHFISITTKFLMASCGPPKKKGGVMDLNGKPHNTTNTINIKDMPSSYVCKMLGMALTKFQHTEPKMEKMLTALMHHLERRYTENYHLPKMII
ncbi:MAG: hypothetical protein IPP27_06615 [Bacteroidetes bacterium]|nr:hypothetical protein [Bacteroidota bacterium]